MQSPAQTASWYARADEQYDMQKTVLAEALSELIDGLKKSLRFRDLQMIEMLFYCQIPNKKVARTMGMDEKAVALIKHRDLKQIRESIGHNRTPGPPPPARSRSDSRSNSKTF